MAGTPAQTVVNDLQRYLDLISKDLDRTVNFWLKFSHDTIHGGFFNCIGRDGTIYDDLKYGWLQGRQVWVYAKLYNTVVRFRNVEILSAAREGSVFLMSKVCTNQTVYRRCYFCVTRDGRPVKLQRTIFTECFYVMAMAQMHKATGEETYKSEAMGMMTQIIFWVKEDDSGLGRLKLEGATPTDHMAVPMMMLCMILELEDMDPELTSSYKELTDWCVQRIRAHVQRGGRFVLEHVSLEGNELPGCQGRLAVPGHAIEGGWFLLEVARKRNDDELRKDSLKHFIQTPFSYGWDEKDGGLLYFVDADGISPTQLEWNMKLWWPHNEALIAFLMAYEQTNDISYLHKFAQILEYCYSHFVDTEYGEWFGYLDRQGQINMDFKGGPYKGCFHVIRCLMMCEDLLKKIVGKQSNGKARD